MVSNSKDATLASRRRAREYAKFCRELAEKTPDGSLRQAILRTAALCEEYLDQSADPTCPSPRTGWNADLGSKRLRGKFNER